jgi:hypothetical protein
MQVVCVKVSNIRPQYQNLKEWCSNPNNVYIGRRGIVFINGERYPKQDSVWANPFKIDKKNEEQSRNIVLTQYRQYIINRLQTEPLLYQEFIKLKGKILGCWCKPQCCHGDTLVELLNMI